MRERERAVSDGYIVERRCVAQSSHLMEQQQCVSFAATAISWPADMTSRPVGFEWRSQCAICAPDSDSATMALNNATPTKSGALNWHLSPEVDAARAGTGWQTNRSGRLLFECESARAEAI